MQFERSATRGVLICLGLAVTMAGCGWSGAMRSRAHPAPVPATVVSHESEVVADYLTLLARQGVTVPQKLRMVLEMDLVEDVMDMTRKKTYGHLSLQDFRQKNAEIIEIYQKRSA